MSDSGNEYRRWAALMDRKAIGEALTPEELEFCEAFVAQNPLAAREAALLDELANMDGPVQGADARRLRPLVDGALERLAAGEDAAAQQAQQDRLAGMRARAPRPRVVWATGAGALAVAGAVAAAFMLMTPSQPQQPVAVQVPAAEPPAQQQEQQPAPRVELVYVSGQVTVDGEAHAGGATMLSEGSVLAVGEQGSACLAMDPEIDLCLQAGSKLTLTQFLTPWRRLDLQHGKVAVQLGEQPEGMRLSIVADGVWSTAVGTAFTVAAGGETEAVHTTVLEGKVRVGGEDDDAQIVAAHQRAEVSDGQATVSALSRTEESPEWALLRPAALWGNPVSATLRVVGLPSEAEIHLGSERVGVAPLTTLVPVGNHTLEVRMNGAVVASRAVEALAGQTAAFDFSDERFEARAEQAVPEARAPRAKGAAEMLGEARQLMRQGRFEQAAQHYRALRRAHPGSREARTVLVPLAQLQLRLGKAGEALQSLDRYLARGRGPLAEEARHTRIRALRALGRGADEARAIEQFLELHPKSFHGRSLERRLEHLKP